MAKIYDVDDYVKIKLKDKKEMERISVLQESFKLKLSAFLRENNMGIAILDSFIYFVNPEFNLEFCTNVITPNTMDDAFPF